MEAKAVVDRIEEGSQAVLLVGEDEREFVIPVEELPEGAGAGAWLRVRLEGADLTVLGIDQGEEDAARQRIEDKLARLRQRGSRSRPSE